MCIKIVRIKKATYWEIWDWDCILICRQNETLMLKDKRRGVGRSLVNESLVRIEYESQYYLGSSTSLSSMERYIYKSWSTEVLIFVTIQSNLFFADNSCVCRGI